MTEKEIQQTYDLICSKYSQYLSKHGVKLPKLTDNNGKYTKNALILVRLAKGYPHTEILSKEQLTEFMREYDPNVSDVQQARHLSMQNGWYILSGQRGDSRNIPSGSYKLESLEKPYPSFIGERRAGFSGDFEALKAAYHYRCATCGVKEGEKHRIRTSVTVQLQQGHMDPTKPLKIGNIIPQCQICNRADRNRWIFDKTGRVIEIAPTEDGKRTVITFLNKANNNIKKDILNILTELLSKTK